MKTRSVVLAFAAMGYVLLFASLPVAQAGGAGVCVLGKGADVTGDQIPAFVGVNVGQHSPTNVFTDQASFEAACCAETGAAPDCFNPVN